jgi:hypothetical protein
MQDGTPRQLNERTGRHRCVKCLAETPDAQYFRNDHICDRCAAEDEYPLQSTPDEPGKAPAKQK